MSLSNFKAIAMFFLKIVLAIFILCSCDNDDGGAHQHEVISIDPQSALPNTLVAIRGNYFSAIFNENKVSFNGKEAIVSVASLNQLNVFVPMNAVSGPVAVSVNGTAAANQPIFTVERFPSIVRSVSPALGRYSTLVTITGDHFLADAASNVVTFNGMPASIQSATPSSLTVLVPARAGTGPVIVNGTTAPVEFTYVPTVYIGGYERTKDVKIQGKFWKDGKATMLDDIVNYSVAQDVHAEGDDVFIAGFQYNGKTSVAKYWKNDEAVILGDGVNYSQLEAIAVVGDDIYVAGYEQNPGKATIARYWKNGVPKSITDGKLNSLCFGIAVQGNDVHTVGQQYLNTGTSVAMYWKNTTPHPLTSSTSAGYAMGIALSGSDVYVAGYEVAAPKKSVALYWKNGIRYTLTDGTYEAQARDIDVVGGNVYVAGYEANANMVGVAKYWKNGIPVILSNEPSVARAIKVLGNDVYVSGVEANAGGVPCMKYWKNGVKVSVTDGVYEAWPYAIDLQ